MLHTDMHADVQLWMVQAKQQELWQAAERQRLIQSARGNRPGIYRRGLQALKRLFLPHTTGAHRRYVKQHLQNLRRQDSPQGHRNSPVSVCLGTHSVSNFAGSAMNAETGCR